MKPLSYPRSLALTLLLGSLGLVGCGSAFNSLPDAVVSPQVQGPPMQGNVYGGHAPIVGAHVYLLQPGTSGYGSAATSLLGNNGATSASGYAITADVNDPNVPVGSKYVTSDSAGNFNLTGGYTCTASQPVYLYSYGTSASTVTTKDNTTTTTSPQTVTITGITASGVTLDTNGNATYQITVSSALPLTAGQAVTIAGLTGNLAIINGAQAALAATSGTNTVFSISATAVYGTYTYYTGGFGNLRQHTYYDTVGTSSSYTATTGPAGNDGGGNDNGNADFDTESGDTSTGTGPFGNTNPPNTATATETTTTTTTTPTTQPELELATLGVCPTSGNFSTPGSGNGALSFVYMNEVSTVATAYTFQPFTLASNNNAWDIGSSGTTQALVGIANAADTAAQLYDIQGASLISTTNDGEGHLANFQTLLNGVPNEGNGVVPQATIDSLANILAMCIDTAPAGGVLSAPCTTLFNTATDNGQTLAAGDTAPTDTATAAINIARYPAGNNSGTADPNYVTDLLGIPTGTVPYAPNLGIHAPNDWTIAINYPETAVSGYASATNPLLGSAESIAVDDIGQVWITAQGTSEASASEVRWSPLGAQNSTNSAGYIYGYISIDGSNNAWAGNANSTSGIEEFGSNGVLTATYGSGYNKAYTVVTNNSGDAFFFASKSGSVGSGGTGGNYEMFEYGPGGTGLTQYSISPSVIAAGNNVAHGAIDSAGDLWLTTEASPYQIARVNSTGQEAFTTLTVGEQPEFPAIDSSGNAWIAIQATTSEIYKVTPTGGSIILTGATTGAELTSTFGAAVDGNGNVWFANRCGNYGACGTTAGENSLIELNGTGTQGTVNTAISPSTNYVPEALYPAATATTFTPILNGSLNLAIDPSGNIWITNYTGDGVVEIVGAAAPVETPLSVAAGINKLGAKP